MVTLRMFWTFSPMAARTSAVPPALGRRRCLKGECWCRCFSQRKRVPSTKLKTETGIALNFSHAFLVISRSSPLSSGLALSSSGERRFMMGKSTAQNACPMMGSHRSSLFTKNLKSGALR
ncbi:MAG: hypothetical protein BWX71_01702 [Deltaproteobacteria bacterium ADurb.Bin072]|nr:MAG: hypothetical protein BWX71_01702 [Deltaproteobacteria bacterium ADurb.Bin072]